MAFSSSVAGNTGPLMVLPYTLIQEHAPQLGLVVLQTDETIEQDMRQLLPPDVEFLVSRVPSGAVLSTDMIAEMEDKLTGAARLFPQNLKFAATAYGCTSASAQIGPQRVAQLLGAGAQTAHVTEPVSALIAACRALSVHRLGLISPYVAAISDRLRAVLKEESIEVTQFDSFEEPIEANVVRISPEALQDAALGMGALPAVDAVFLSCTNLRTLGIIDAIERKIDKPVLSSNQVLAWHLLRLSDIPARPDAPGRLWRV